MVRIPDALASWECQSYLNPDNSYRKKLIELEIKKNFDKRVQRRQKAILRAFQKELASLEELERKGMIQEEESMRKMNALTDKYNELFEKCKNE